MIIRSKPPTSEIDKLFSALGEDLARFQLAGFTPKYFDGEVGYFELTDKFIEYLANQPVKG